MKEKSIASPETSTLAQTARPTLIISGRELTESLITTVEFELYNHQWTIMWQKQVSSIKFWRIDAQNIDSIDIHPLDLLNLIDQTTVQLLYLMIMDDCAQTVIRGGNFDCFSMDYLPKLRKEVTKPLLKSYMAKTTKCVKSEFYLDHLKMQIGDPFKQRAYNSSNSLEKESTTELIGFEVKLCH